MSDTIDGGTLGGVPPPTQGEGYESLKETRLVERALREAWPIPETLRPQVIKRLGRIVRSKSASSREHISASKALLTASKINLDVVGVTIAAKEHEELEPRLAELERRVRREPQK